MRFFLYLFLLCLGFQQTMAQQSKFPEFECHHFYSKEGILPYRLLLPKEYDQNKKYPLVIFFHGAGERGIDNEINLNHIHDLFLNEENRNKYPCFLLIPQCPVNEKWVDTDWTALAHTMPEKPSAPMQMSIDLLALIQQQYAIDNKRLYVTGLSMGGFATWDLIMRYPDTYAAAIPICGGADDSKAALIKDMPLWIFHGTLDKVVFPERSRNIAQAIRMAGGNPKYTEYPAIAHGSWKAAYLEPDLLEWLFSQSKK